MNIYDKQKSEKCEEKKKNFIFRSWQSARKKTAKDYLNKNNYKRKMKKNTQKKEREF